MPMLMTNRARAFIYYKQYFVHSIEVLYTTIIIFIYYDV